MIGALAIGLVALATLRIWWLKRQMTWSPPTPRRHDLPLAARVVGDGERTVLMLHGLAGSGRYFGGEYDALAADCRLVVPDLLGFGGSRGRGERYGVDAHLEALHATLDALAVRGPITVVGHSTGCVLAVALAREDPALVGHVVAIAPALYPDRERARAKLNAMGPIVRLFAMETPAAKRVCAWMCAHRRAAGWMAILARPDLPTTVARDGVQHTWRSYVQTLRDVIIDSGSAHWLDEIQTRVDLVVGDQDAVILTDVLAASATRAGITLHTLHGGHDLPLTHGDACRALIRATL